MPTTREIDLDEFKKLATIRNPGTRTLEQIERDGHPLILEESVFSDPGDDYAKVIQDGEQILYIPGY